MNNLDGDRKIDAGIKLNRSEEKFNKLFEYSPFGMAMIKHATGEFIEVNQALLQWTGYTKEEFLNLSFWDITPPEYQYQEKQQMLDLEAKGRFGPNDKEYIRKDGSRFPIRIKGFTIEDVDGTKLVWGIIEDISNEYERILESLQDAYIQFDLAYHLIMVNKGAVKMFGYTTKDEMIGMKLHDFFVDHSIFNRIKEDLETSHKLSNCICECLRKNGTSLWISFNAQHIKDKNDKTVSMEGLMRDTTERKRLEDSLINKGKELEASEERFRLMIENIS
ncbi:MAG: PAS domain S-box protein, partial [Bacilli bacterium]|nr:PAS domain S-box protein [Bacilli bacterium]